MKNNVICILGKTGSGKGICSQVLSNYLELKTTSIGDIIRNYCKDNNLSSDRNKTTELGNTIFTGEKLSYEIDKILPHGGIIDGIRKPETLYYIMQKYNCYIVGILANDISRYHRSQKRGRVGDSCTYKDFIKQEISENTYPNKQNINLLLSICDKYIENNSNKNDFNEEIRSSISSIDFKKVDINQYIDKLGYKHFARSVVTDGDYICLLYDKNKGYYTLPGGKVDNYETPDITIKRELEEELSGIEEADTVYKGTIKGLYPDGLNKGHFFETVIKNHRSITSKEQEKHILKWINKNDLKNISLDILINTGLYHRLYSKRCHENNGDIKDIFNTKGYKDNKIIQYYDPKTDNIYINEYDDYFVPMRVLDKSIHQNALEMQKIRYKSLKNKI